MKLTYSILACICLGLLPYATFAEERDPLKDVLDSKAMATMVKTSKLIRNKSKTNWIDKSSNYGSLFLGKSKGSIVLDWLAGGMRQFRHGTIRERRNAESLSIRTIFEKDKPKEAFLHLVIPHPRYKTAADLGVLMIARDTLPKKTDIILEERLETPDDSTANLYILRDGSCSIHAHAARGSSLVLSSSKCEDATDLVNVFEALDLPRLNRKLNS